MPTDTDVILDRPEQDPLGLQSGLPDCPSALGESVAHCLVVDEAHHDAVVGLVPLRART
jgi:hypothetical protein